MDEVQRELAGRGSSVEISGAGDASFRAATAGLPGAVQRQVDGPRARPIRAMNPLDYKQAGVDYARSIR